MSPTTKYAIGVAKDATSIIGPTATGKFYPTGSVLIG